MLGFHLFGGSGEFCGNGDLGDFLFQERPFVKEMRSTLNDSMKGSVATSMVK